jgi:hypothetical protein
LSRRVSASVRSSLSSDLLSRYAHFFDAYVNVRYAWLTLPWLLVQQFVMAAFLGLAVPAGGCDYEQVLPLTNPMDTCPLARPLISAGRCHRQPVRPLAPSDPDAAASRCRGVRV